MSGLDYERAKRFIAGVPQGQWTAFKDVAEAAGSPGAAMSIGVWLGAEGGTVVNPWRVVRADGSVPPDYHSDAPGCPHNATEARVKHQRGVCSEAARAALRAREPAESLPRAGQAAERYRTRCAGRADQRASAR